MVRTGKKSFSSPLLFPQDTHPRHSGVRTLTWQRGHSRFKTPAAWQQTSAELNNWTSAAGAPCLWKSYGETSARDPSLISSFPRHSLLLCCRTLCNLKCVCVLSSFCRVWFFATLWAVAHQAPLSMEFSMQERWSGLLCPPPGDLPTPGIEPSSFTFRALAGRFFTTSATWEALEGTQNFHLFIKKIFFKCIYLCLCWVFVAAQRLSLVAVSRGYSLVAEHGLLTAVAPCVVGLVALWHVGS